MAKSAVPTRAGTVTGIEYGKRAIRIATLSVGRSGKFAVKALTQVLVQHGRRGVAEDASTNRKAALKEALGKHTKDLGSIIVGIPREDVISRFVTLPSSDPIELREMLFFDVERYLPFPPEEAEISYRVLEQIAANESHIVMVAARTKDLYQILEDLDEAGVQPLRLDVEAHGSAYTYSRENGQVRSEPFALLHLDLEVSLIGLVIDSQLRFSRAMPVSTEELEMNSIGTNFDGLPESWPEHQVQWWNSAVINLKRTLAGFSHEKYGEQPKRVYLSGPGSTIPGLPQALEKEFSVPVVIEEPVSAGKITEPVLVFLNAIGLALEELETTHHINLVPEEIYQRREASRKKQFLVNSTTLLVLNLILLGTWLGHAFWNKQEVLGILNNKILEIRGPIKDVEVISEKLKVISQNIDKQNSAYKVLKDMFERTPDRVKIEQLNFQKSDLLELTLETFTGTDLDGYVAILGGSPYFAGPIERGRVETIDLTRRGNFGVDRYQKVTGVRAMLRTNPKLQEAK